MKTEPCAQQAATLGEKPMLSEKKNVFGIIKVISKISFDKFRQCRRGFFFCLFSFVFFCLLVCLFVGCFCFCFCWGGGGGLSS